MALIPWRKPKRSPKGDIGPLRTLTLIMDTESDRQRMVFDLDATSPRDTVTVKWTNAEITMSGAEWRRVVVAVPPRV